MSLANFLMLSLEEARVEETCWYLSAIMRATSAVIYINEDAKIWDEMYFCWNSRA
jgi:hypothetical protein